MSEYWATKNGTHQIKGNPLDLGVRVVDKKIWDITELTNIVNGTFYWYNKDWTTYPTSILYANGIVHQNMANHLWDNGKPQSVFVIYKNGFVDMKRIKDISQLGNLDLIHVAIGGVGLVNKFDPSFKYSLEAEGFIGKNADVARKTNKTVLGYNKKEDKVYLMVRANIYHKHLLQYDLLKLVRDCGYDIAISLDGGGSTFMDAYWKYVFKGEAGRRIHNVVGFGI
jgi:hypothetical protein